MNIGHDMRKLMEKVDQILSDARTSPIATKGGNQNPFFAVNRHAISLVGHARREIADSRLPPLDR